MNTAEFYEKTGSNYQEAKARMLDDSRILRFVKMFERDTAFERLRIALSQDRTEDAFHAAHDLKGVSLTLSLTSLAENASAVTEALRAGDLTGAKALYPALEEIYKRVVSLIADLQNS